MTTIEYITVDVADQAQPVLRMVAHDVTELLADDTGPDDERVGEQQDTSTQPPQPCVGHRTGSNDQQRRLDEDQQQPPGLQPEHGPRPEPDQRQRKPGNDHQCWPDQRPARSSGSLRISQTSHGCNNVDVTGPQAGKEHRAHADQHPRESSIQK
jgi:hypothetical protein